MDRRSFVVTVLGLSTAGCLARGQKERRIHRPVREWEADPTFDMHVASDETLVVRIDTRRVTPDSTLVQVAGPDGTGIGKARLRDNEPRATFSIENTGTHRIFVRPERNQGRARVWVEITIDDGD
ncbi:hypothetical protein C479_00260 [Halovivax asiaticus JCM 14624]|uniref:Uncharacterized protein n=1 Tax=Halovivax asiaticus JCM 14624 TaxID=1227490 RepID=M0BX90_9EURY|nr:hypothetical protein [Halovivax asiaticus]ELZ14294.1 hypothetical protein C479_00260 [Halovivax asiaticus JCM 14624]